MTRVRQDAQHAECTTPRPAAAAHLSGSHAGRPLLFDDMEEFDGMPAGWRPGRPHAELGNDYGHRVVKALRTEDRQARRHRYTPAGLLPGALRLRLVATDHIVDDAPGAELALNLAAIEAAITRAPYARHEDAFVMLVAPILAMLAELEPVADAQAVTL